MSGVFSRSEKLKLTLEERVTRSAEGALEAQQHVSAIDVLMSMGLLHQSNLDAWRHGRIGFLEDTIQGSPERVGWSLKLFREWAESRGLQSVEARYARTTREGDLALEFTHVKYPELDQALRAHYVSPKLSGRRKQAVEKKVTASPERVMFLPGRDSACTECGRVAFRRFPGDGGWAAAVSRLCGSGRSGVSTPRRHRAYPPGHQV